MTFPIPTSLQIDAHPAGAVLDRLIAIHVFGRSDRHPEDLDPEAEKPRRRGAGRAPGTKVYYTDPCYSARDEIALLVLQEFVRRGTPMTIEFDPKALQGVWQVAVLPNLYSPEWGMAPSLALAVCRAALHAQDQLAQPPMKKRGTHA